MFSFLSFCFSFQSGFIIFRNVSTASFEKKTKSGKLPLTQAPEAARAPGGGFSEITEIISLRTAVHGERL